MENIATTPITETPIINQPEFVLPPPKKNYLTIFLISLVFILFVTCVYLLFKQSSIVTPDTALQTPTKPPVAVIPFTTNIPTTKVVPTVTVDPTASWKKFTNTKYGYYFKYPSNYAVSQNGMVSGNPALVSNIVAYDSLASDPIQTPRFAVSVTSDNLDSLQSQMQAHFDKVSNYKISVADKQKTSANLGYEIQDNQIIVGITKISFIGKDAYTYTIKGNFVNDGVSEYLVPVREYKYIWILDGRNVLLVCKEDVELTSQILSTFKFTESKATSLGNWTKQTDNHYKTNSNCLWILTVKENYSGNLSSYVSKFYGNNPIEKLLDPTQYQVRDTQTITTSAQGVGELFTIFFDKNNLKHAITFSVTSQDDILSKPQCKNYLTDVDYVLNNIDLFI